LQTNSPPSPIYEATKTGRGLDLGADYVQEYAGEYILLQIMLINKSFSWLYKLFQHYSVDYDTSE
jgi:hypothetical protein